MWNTMKFVQHAKVRCLRNVMQGKVFKWAKFNLCEQPHKIGVGDYLCECIRTVLEKLQNDLQVLPWDIL